MASLRNKENKIADLMESKGKLLTPNCKGM